MLFYHGEIRLYDFLSCGKTYFDSIEADSKEFIAYEQSAHYPQFEEKEKFYKWMTDTFVKKIQLDVLKLTEAITQ